MEISEKLKKLIEDESDDLDDSSEKISEAFICCVCLELLYKPIVLACGHVSCFWCVHQSMSGLRESHCPICRHSYHHFPTICQMLHLILLKMYPVAYKRRQIQILDFEEKANCFSPQLEGSVCMRQTEQEMNHVDVSQRCEGSGLIVEDSLQIPVEDIGVSGIIVNDKDGLHQTVANGTCQRITIDDALCSFCNQLIYRPVVLNCGHVYCESCFVVQPNETIKCVKCLCRHPGRAPKVCLELDKFLEEQFGTDYAQRRSSVQLKKSCSQEESPSSCTSDDVKEKTHLFTSAGENPLSWWADHNVHIGAGCDSCGMYPIIGDRYRCKDCVEKIGFDLCGDCYTTSSKLPGRFNQQHTPEHQFELARPNSIRNIMLRLLRGQVGDVSPASNGAGDASDSIGSVIPSLSEDAGETVESGFVSADDAEEDQGNLQDSM